MHCCTRSRRSGKPRPDSRNLFETLKEHYQRDYSLIMQALQEERYRCERLEEQLNDLTELHQNEILNLKQELASMEEKIAYQSYERARDIQEALEACQTRISKMELQQQQQQVVQLEGLENATARNLLGKLINILLAVMAVLLVFVSTVANCVVPLMKTRSRTFSTLLLVVFIAFSGSTGTPSWATCSASSPHPDDAAVARNAVLPSSGECMQRRCRRPLPSSEFSTATRVE